MTLPLFGSKEFARLGFPTPESLPEETACRTFTIPGSTAWLAVVMGCLYLLADPDNWQEFDGGITRDEAAERAAVMLDQAYDDIQADCPTGSVPTPFWDDAPDLDDELPDDVQPWYGEVTDYTAPPYELEFVEAAGIWAITGFVAYAGGLGSAVAFQTIAPRFVLAWKRGDLGELIRVVIDSADYQTVDTGTVGVGEIVSLNVLPDQDLETHDILIVKVG